MKIEENLQILHIFPEKISCPVDKIEEGKHEWKEYSWDDINTLGSCWKFW